MNAEQKESVNMAIGAADASSAEPEAPSVSTKNSEVAVVSVTAVNYANIHDAVSIALIVTARPFALITYAVDVVMSAGGRIAVPIRETKTGASSAPGIGYAIMDVSENNASLVEA